MITGCSSTTAKQWMNNLPIVLPIPLYKHQDQRLVRELTKVQFLANVIYIGQPEISHIYKSYHLRIIIGVYTK